MPTGSWELHTHKYTHLIDKALGHVGQGCTPTAGAQQAQASAVPFGDPGTVLVVKVATRVVGQRQVECSTVLDKCNITSAHQALDSFHLLIPIFVVAGVSGGACAPWAAVAQLVIRGRGTVAGEFGAHVRVVGGAHLGLQCGSTCV